MAGIGLYGVYYALETSAGVNGIVYQGIKQMGKAISATFEPGEANNNPLYANNGIAENDGLSASGGTLSLTIDHLSYEAIHDLFGVSVSESSGTITELSYGANAPAHVGVAFVRWNQLNNNRNNYEAVIISDTVFSLPSDAYQTLGESVEWQTVDLEAAVSGQSYSGAPWMKKKPCTTQQEAIDWITETFAAPTGG